MYVSSQSTDSPDTDVICDGDRVAVLQVALSALTELIRQEHPDTHSRLLSCLQHTRDLPENTPYSSAFDELLAMLDDVQR